MTTRRKFSYLVISGVAALALLPTLGVSASAATAIQPGARIVSGDSACTQNFIFEDTTGDLYAGTAAHCVAQVGDRVANDDGEFGTVAYMGDPDSNSADVAFIKIDSDKEGAVSPTMLGFGGPGGFISGDEAGFLDGVRLHGHGLILGDTSLTRSRSGVLQASDSQEYFATLPAIFGDSGGPVLHESGAALGIISRIATGALGATVEGPTVEHALRLASAAGLDLTLVNG